MKIQSEKLASPSPAPASALPSLTKIAPPGKVRRKPIFIVLGAALALAGMLGMVAIVNAVSHTSPVVVARTNLSRGQMIKDTDVQVLNIAADPALQTIPGSQISSVIGKRAATDIAAGTLVTPEQAQEKMFPGKGKSLVGLSVTSAQLPSGQVREGDQIRIMSFADKAASATVPGPEEAGGPTKAVVFTVGKDDTSGQTVLTVEVDEARALALAAAMSGGKIVIILDSKEQ